MSLSALLNFCNSSSGVDLIKTAAKRRDLALQRQKETGETSFNSYPLAPALINMTRFVCELFQLCSEHGIRKDVTKQQGEFFGLLPRGEESFYEILISCMMILETQWEQVGGGYMNFPLVLSRTKEIVVEFLRNRVLEMD